MKAIFSIILSLLFFTAAAEVNKDRLDALPAQTKVFLFKDIYYNLPDSSENSVFMDSLVSKTSNRNIKDFFPYVIEDVLLTMKNEVNFTLAESDEKAFRKLIVDNINTHQRSTLLNNFVKYISSLANDSNEVEMSSPLYKEGKVYVVVTVLCTILLGIAIYLFSLQRKIVQLKKL